MFILASKSLEMNSQHLHGEMLKCWEDCLPLFVVSFGREKISPALAYHELLEFTLKPGTFSGSFLGSGPRHLQLRNTISVGNRHSFEYIKSAVSSNTSTVANE